MTEVVVEVRPVSALSSMEQLQLQAVRKEKKSWAKQGLVLYIIANRNALAQRSRIIAPFDSMISIGDVVVSHGRWTYAVQVASSHGDSDARELHIAERLEIAGSEFEK